MSIHDSNPGTAVVTGASTGIGRALAREFARHGHDLVIAADEDRINEAAAEMEGFGVLVHAVEVDLATPAGVEELYAAIPSDRVSALALNAGIGVSGRFDQTRLGDQLRLIDLNVRSLVHLAHLVIRDMVANGHGRVLVTSSIAANGPGPFHATYAASKAFGHSFAEAVRQELKDTGVTVTSLMPGPTDTAFFERADMLDTKIAQGPKDDPAEVAADGYKALMAGRPSVVAGAFRNKVQAELASHLPDSLTAPLMGSLAKPRDESEQGPA